MTKLWGLLDPKTAQRARSVYDMTAPHNSTDGHYVALMTDNPAAAVVPITEDVLDSIEPFLPQDHIPNVSHQKSPYIWASSDTSASMSPWCHQIKVIHRIAEDIISEMDRPSMSSSLGIAWVSQQERTLSFVSDGYETAKKIITSPACYMSSPAKTADMIMQYDTHGHIMTTDLPVTAKEAMTAWCEFTGTSGI